MTHDEITNGLNQLGFNSGYVVTGDKITVWENVMSQPSFEEIKEAAKLWSQTEKNKQAARLQAKQAAEIKLKALGLTADDLIALGL
jgi:hypothetical protein